MIRSGFFNSIEGDRTYNAEDMSGMYEGMITDGILQGVGAELKVAPCSPAGMRVSVASGKAILAGKWLRNTDDVILSVEASDTQPRIDLVVAELNYTNREFILCVKKGTPAEVPSVPELEDSSDKKELPLARIRIEANTASVTKDNILDLRQHAAVNNVIFPSRTVKRKLYPNTYISQSLSTVNPEAGLDLPGNFEDVAGVTSVIDIDCGGYHYTEIEVLPNSEVTVPQYGTWVAMPLPDGLYFPETADVLVEYSKNVLNTAVNRNLLRKEKTDLYIRTVTQGKGDITNNGALMTAPCGYVKIMTSGQNNKFTRVKASFIGNFS